MRHGFFADLVSGAAENSLSLSLLGIAPRSLTRARAAPSLVQTVAMEQQQRQQQALQQQRGAAGNRAPATAVPAAMQR